MTSPERAEAIRGLEIQFSDLFARVRRLYAENAQIIAPGLQPGSYKLFTMIARRGPLTASIIAERLEIDKAQISRMLRELESFELIERKPDPEDRRSQLISATPEGLRRLETAHSGHHAQFRNTLEAWDVEDIRKLTSLLGALTEQGVPGA